nr:proteoglycan 4 isoform X2 [Aotus nancymaae]
MAWKTLPIYLLLLLSVFLIQQVSSQDLSSCAGRCGEGYSRDATCSCDFNCQHYMDCCLDFKRVCTVELSCKGRCFESFERGRECDCDAQCTKFGKCCPDYDSFCEEVKDNKKNRTKKTHAPKPPVEDEAGSGLDNDDFKVTTTPDMPTTPHNKVTTSPKTTTAKPINPRPSLPPNSDTSKETSLTANKETTVETKETTKTNKQTSTDAKEKTTAAKETKSVEKTSAKDSAPTSKVPAIPTLKAETTTKGPALTISKEPAPTTPKQPAPTTTKQPAPTTPKEPAPTTPKEPAPTTPPAPTPETPPPTTSEASTPATTMEPPTSTESPDESTPELSAEPTTKTPALTNPEMTTTAKDKTTEKDIHTTPETTTAAPKMTKETTTTEKTTGSKVTSTTTQVTSTTTQDTTPFKITTLRATSLAPKVTTTTKKTITTTETMNTPEETANPKDTATNSKATTPKPQKPKDTQENLKAPKKPTSTKKPKTTPRVRKPKTTPTPRKMTSTMPELNPTSTVAEAMIQTTTRPNQTPDSRLVEVNPKNEDANAAEGETPHMILRPHVFTPIVIPGVDYLLRVPNQGIFINPMLSDETNICNGKPVDGLTTLRNGTLVAFRGHYFWMLSPFSPPSPARRITEVWGIPSPIDTVFTRCNCEGKTFFFKDSQYWRFTNDIKDAGYPKPIVKGFRGLTGQIVAALSIAKYKNRPESVYFFKRGGNIQKYIYKQEPVQKCPGRRPALNYPVYGETTQVRRRRFERAIGPSQTHTIRIHYSPVRLPYQDKATDFLHNEVKVSTLWRGLPNMVTSAIALPNIRKPDGYDYYAFSKDQYYNIDVPSRTARAITTRSGQTLSKVWYNCP